MNPHQRAGKDKLSEERRKRLEEIGSAWDQNPKAWDKGFSHLKLYLEREGHCRVPHTHKEGSFRLGIWVGTQRYGKDKLSEERRKRLDDIGFSWDPFSEDWEEGFRLLKLYQEREGHCRVPQIYKEGGYRLGQWVSVQRQKKDTLSEERRKRLEEIGFTWDQLAENWEEGFRVLKLYLEREGHCKVPHTHKEGSFRLGIWVGTQRRVKDSLSEERRKRLDGIEFVWDPFTEAWEEGFSHLKLYREREGHSRVPGTHKEGSLRLGGWVQTQRAVKDTISEERHKRLEEIGFTWDPLSEDWDEGFRLLKLYLEREGSCRVPAQHKEGSFRLGTWVGTQRYGKDKLSKERRKRLDGVGFIWAPRKP